MMNNLTTVYHKKPQKVYNLVKQLLEEYPETRDSDKKLIWRIWNRLDLTHYNEYEELTISESDFMEAPSTESIRRCRQKLQETHPELRGSKYIQDKRSEIALDKGTYVYREEVQPSLL